MGEISSEPIRKPLKPANYEIESLWSAVGSSTTRVPSTVFQKAHTYRIRARARDASGRCGHWSEPMRVKT